MGTEAEAEKKRTVHKEHRTAFQRAALKGYDELRDQGIVPKFEHREMFWSEGEIWRNPKNIPITEERIVYFAGVPDRDAVHISVFAHVLSAPFNQYDNRIWFALEAQMRINGLAVRFLRVREPLSNFALWVPERILAEQFKRDKFSAV